ncbi:hypothetical protein BsWGS_28909 [Bradybaena similaris]
MWCWKRLLRIPWTAKKTNKKNKYVLVMIKLGVSQESKILKQKLQYYGHVMRNDSSLEKNNYARKDARKKESRETANEMDRRGGGIDTDELYRTLINNKKQKHKENPNLKIARSLKRLNSS